jgi:hypothetical protein
MNVAVYAEPGSSIPYLRVLSAGLDTVEQAAQKFLEPQGITYRIVDDSTIPESPFFPGTQTVNTGPAVPVFSWEFTEAQTWAQNYNAEYWQKQYDLGILGLSIDNPYQLQLAIATPENERTADQVAAVEFLSGTNQLQSSVDDEIIAATTPEELNTILSRLT